MVDRKKIVIKLKERELDLTEVLPFTIGDWRVMKGKFSIDVLKMGSVGLDIDQIANLIHHACRKVDPQIKLPEIEELHLGDPQIKDVLDAISGVVQQDPSG